MEEHFTKFVNTEKRYRTLCSVLDKNQNRWKSFVKQINQSDFPSASEIESAEEVLNRCKDGSHVTTSKLLELLKKISHKRANGQKIAERGPHLVSVLDSLVSRDGLKNKILLDSIKCNGSELGVRLVCGQFSEIIVFHLGIVTLLKTWIREPKAHEHYEEGMKRYWKTCYKQSAEYFQKAADMNYPLASMRLYKVYHTDGVEDTEDEKLAKKFKTQCLQFKEWFVDKAEVGKPEDQYHLGLYYEDIAEDFEQALFCYQKAIDQNFIPALNCLASCYESGHGVPIDLHKAFSLYMQASEKGFIISAHNAARCYRDGKGVEQNDEEAAKWFLKAAEEGYVWSMVEYGRIRENQENWDEAVKWYQKAAEENDIDAQYNLGFCYAQGTGVAQDYSKALHWFMKAAEQGDADSQYWLGHYYSGEEGQEEDYDKAIHWYKKAVKQNHSGAQCALGYCYENGIGVDEDYDKAFEYYKLAAEQGDAQGQYNMGASYEEGVGTEPDDKEAFQWYLKAAEQDHAAGLYQIGIKYLYGLAPVEKHVMKGLTWLKKSAELGDADAQNEVGKHYMKSSYSEDVKWFQKAAEQGQSSAQCSLGDCYYYGNGVKQDYVTAASWYQKAADLDDATAALRLARCYEFGEGVTQDLERATSILFDVDSDKSQAEQDRIDEVYKIQSTQKEEVDWN